ncbi:unnamed protein product [Pneumocystis jirovecii]|uniref:Mss4-like protein n=2 Tax=Pneumocystis jirovecii TaxID=42068 RepID=L0PDY5_PNEJI|nr:uncharacterized protein T551_01003 [Pneumocystis jirovecii RU7]KTW31742.1 hypothetical protein T551_01003 [Pneumocystis jirovecii RU7]CCJ30304.1 unnamed protein product [Pneumocystis jirovecii]
MSIINCDATEGIKNAETLYCPYPKCKSVILLKDMGVLVYRKNKISYKNDNVSSSDTMSTFWTVSSPFVFENLGFSKNIEGNIKFLACADCDRGPLGYYDPNVLNNGEEEYLLATDKVAYGIPSNLD